MIKTTTQHDVLRYVYNETSSEENTEIEKQIICDDEKSESFFEFTETKRKLEETFFEPSKKSIDAILAFSKLYSKLETAQ